MTKHSHPTTNQQAWTITPNLTLNITLGLLVAVLLFVIHGVWNLRGALERFESRMQSVERAARSAWTYSMEREAWSEWAKRNPDATPPNIQEIRRLHLDASNAVPPWQRETSPIVGSPPPVFDVP